VIPEDSGFGAGFLSTTGAVYNTTNLPFTFTCTNQVPNIRIRTNYLLTATNDNPGGVNYVRVLDTATDVGALGAGSTTQPYATPSTSFGVGQSMCVNNAPVTGFSFPAYGTVLVAPVVTPGTVNTQATSQNTQNTQNTQATSLSNAASQFSVTIPPFVPINQMQTQGANTLSPGGVAGIVITILILVGVGLAVLFVWYRRKRGSVAYQYETQHTDVNLPTTTPGINVGSTIPDFYTVKPLPVVPILIRGMSVMARYSGDGREYRAVIEDIRPGPQYLIRYIDFGNDKEWLPVSCVRAMS